VNIALFPLDLVVLQFEENAHGPIAVGTFCVGILIHAFTDLGIACIDVPGDKLTCQVLGLALIEPDALA
jgi:hypothetical protein